MKNNIQKQEKRWFLLLNSFRFAILLFALGFTFPCFAGETVTYTLEKEYFLLQIDCNGIDDAGTSDTITVSFYNDSTLLLKTSKNVGGGLADFEFLHPDFWKGPSDTPQCNSVEDALYGLNLKVDKFKRDGNNNHDLYQNENIKVTRVVIETNGSNAFWMDEVRLRKIREIKKRTVYDSENRAPSEKVETEDTLLQHWGRDGGQGYCLSTDPNDASGSWANHVQLCAKSLTFKTISADDVFVTAPVENPVSSIVKLPISATVMYDAERAYFFKGDEYIRYSVSENRVPDGFPKKVQENWRNWPSSFVNIDAAVMYPNGSAYFFKGDEYIPYNVSQNRVPDGYPKKIQGHWHNWPSDFVNIDAAVMYPNGSAYFFKGDEYIPYNVSQNRVPDGYPKKIQDGWRNWPSDFVNIDAAVMYNTESAYFFKGDEYIRYSVSENRVPDGYPKKIQGNWHGFVR